MNQNNQFIGLLAIVILLGAIYYALVIRPSGTSPTVINNQPVVPNSQTATTAITGTSAAPSLTETPTPSVPNKTTVKEITVTGANYSFTPNTIVVTEGDQVEITFKNQEGFHDFVIDELNVRTKQLSEGKEETIRFTADKPGSFEFYCSVGNHRQMGMKGTFTVKPKGQ